MLNLAKVTFLYFLENQWVPVSFFQVRNCVCGDKTHIFFNFALLKLGVLQNTQNMLCNTLNVLVQNSVIYNF